MSAAAIAGAASAADRVLVLMPTARDSARTASLLGESGVQSTRCADLTDLCREIRAGAGAVLLTDETLSLDTSGQLAEAMREQPTWSALPVLVVAREGWAHDVQRATSDAFRSVIIVERPVRTRTLLSVVLSALRSRRHQYEIRDALLEQERQAARLAAQDERLRFALAAGGFGSWDLDLDTTEMECSDIFKANFGRPEGEPFTYAQLRESIHPEDRRRVAEAIERSISSDADYDVEYRVVWPKGDVHWVLVRGRARRDAAGQARRMTGVSVDITERKHMHDALQQSESELARQAAELRLADRRKDEFLATLAHELRNPLAPIRTGLELLTRSPDGDGAQHTLGVMQRQIAHMVRLIDDLLDVSRITRGKLELDRQRVELGAIVDAAVEICRPLIERKQHAFRVVVPEPTLAIQADLTRIAQVIGNLLNNAAKYTIEGGSIELSAKRDGDDVVIQVRDDGVGIPPDRLSDVFEMFSQVNRALERSQGGLGIGLALVRSLVGLHGGRVEASSPGIGRGSTFTVRLPIGAVRQASTPTENSQSTPEVQDKKRVLVVDDNEDAADLLSMVLEQSGYETRTVYDGRSAIGAALEWSPSLVVLDIGLPDMSGYDVARELRQPERRGPLTLIALTGWGTQDDKRRAMEAGFDVHLTKPVDAAAFHAALAQLEAKRSRASDAAGTGGR
jgi:signal transduction histidine kinase/ActR/RegA family two-component response regulator